MLHRQKFNKLINETCLALFVLSSNYSSVADPFHFDMNSDLDPEYEKNRYGSGFEKRYGSRQKRI